MRSVRGGTEGKWEREEETAVSSSGVGEVQGSVRVSEGVVMRGGVEGVVGVRFTRGIGGGVG